MAARHSREEDMSNPYDTAQPRKASVLGPTLKFKGELTAEEDLLIQGSIEGSIRHSSSLTIGEGGRVKANVSAEYVAVEGNVEGDIHGTQSVTIRETANINGNISSPTVSLLEGATFNGKIDMTGKAFEKPADDSATARAAAAVAAERDGGKEEASPAKKLQKPARKSADAA
jgi:cytoskeletal protein CcmA (bactofilin family)